jgi:hypothetical protein
MPCLLALAALITPRVVIILVWLFSDYLGRAYHTALWPLLGFLFMPLTTLAYAWAFNSTGGAISGTYIAVVVLAVLFDVGIISGGEARRRRWEVRRR